MQKLFLTFLIILFTTTCKAQIITTIAGSDTRGFSGDGGPASMAKLASPNFLDVDSAGNIYFIDYENFRIRKIDTHGIITTIAGGGTNLSLSDTIMATDAELGGVWGIRIDKKNNIYFCDNNTNCVRKVDTIGVLYTVAGGLPPGYNGDNIPARTAQFNGLDFITLDAYGNIYVGDKFNYRIRKIDTAGYIHTYAGNGSNIDFADHVPATATGLRPQGMGMDRWGNLYVQDTSFIRKIDTNGIIHTLYGIVGAYGCTMGAINGSLLRIKAIHDITVDDTGGIWYSDFECNYIRYIRTDGSTVPFPINDTSWGFAGDGGNAAYAKFTAPCGLELTPTGKMYIGDNGNNRIRCIDFTRSVRVSEVHNETQALKLKILNNPCYDGVIHFIVEGLQLSFQYLFTDINGKNYTQGSGTTGQKIDINTSGLTKGIYLLKINNENAESTARVIIQ